MRTRKGTGDCDGRDQRRLATRRWRPTSTASRGAPTFGVAGGLPGAALGGRGPLGGPSIRRRPATSRSPSLGGVGVTVLPVPEPDRQPRSCSRWRPAGGHRGNGSQFSAPLPPAARFNRLYRSEQLTWSTSVPPTRRDPDPGPQGAGGEARGPRTGVDGAELQATPPCGRRRPPVWPAVSGPDVEPNVAPDLEGPHAIPPTPSASRGARDRGHAQRPRQGRRCRHGAQGGACATSQTKVMITLFALFAECRTRPDLGAHQRGPRPSQVLGPAARPPEGLAERPTARRTAGHVGARPTVPPTIGPAAYGLVSLHGPAHQIASTPSIAALLQLPPFLNSTGKW